MRKKRGKAAKRQWNANKTTWNGRTYDSKAEADYHKLLSVNPDVLKVEVQPVFEIIPAYTVTCYRCFGSCYQKSEKTNRPIKCTLCRGEGQKVKQGAKYTADFKVYYKDGRTEIIDIKGGPVSRDFPLRRKLLEKDLGVEVTVVESKNGKWVRKR